MKIKRRHHKECCAHVRLRGTETLIFEGAELFTPGYLRIQFAAVRAESGPVWKIQYRLCNSPPVPGRNSEEMTVQGLGFEPRDH